MKKVLKKVWRFIKLSIVVPPVFLWWLGLFICGLIQQVRIIRNEHPSYTVAQAFDIMDADRVGEKAWIIVTEAIGRTDVKWKRG